MKLFFLICITVLFSSCIKDRTCVCYYQSSAGGPGASQQFIHKVKGTKKNAAEKCEGASYHIEDVPYDQIYSCALDE